MKLILPFYFLLQRSQTLFDGKAYISLVGFMFKDTKLLCDHSWFGTFEEINLRFLMVRKKYSQTRRCLYQ
jgi:uncharacterized protein YqjF (DUF2071 family)